MQCSGKGRRRRIEGTTTTTRKELLFVSIHLGSLSTGWFFVHHSPFIRFQVNHGATERWWQLLQIITSRQAAIRVFFVSFSSVHTLQFQEIAAVKVYHDDSCPLQISRILSDTREISHKRQPSSAITCSAFLGIHMDEWLAQGKELS